MLYLKVTLFIEYIMKNKKVFLGGISVILVTAITMIPLTLSDAGGQGKTQGNSCMAQCIGALADTYDASKEITQTCKEICNVGTGQGSCLTTEDGCCVPYTEDPDCVCITAITVLWISDESPAVGFSVTLIEYDPNNPIGTTDEFGIVTIPCDSLEPETTYTAFALSGENGGTQSFTTDSDGRADVTVYVS